MFCVYLQQSVSMYAFSLQPESFCPSANTEIEMWGSALNSISYKYVPAIFRQTDTQRERSSWKAISSIKIYIYVPFTFILPLVRYKHSKWDQLVEHILVELLTMHVPVLILIHNQEVTIWEKYLWQYMHLFSCYKLLATYASCLF